jgi:RHH-type rel operon transcriptional repressor/antitoxin RelB
VYSGDCLATTVRQEPAIEQQLEVLAELTGRAKAFYLRQLFEAGMDKLEDANLGAAVAERIRLDKERTYCLDEVVSELGLDTATL